MKSGYYYSYYVTHLQPKVVRSKRLHLVAGEGIGKRLVSRFCSQNDKKIKMVSDTFCLYAC